MSEENMGWVLTKKSGAITEYTWNIIKPEGGYKPSYPAYPEVTLVRHIQGSWQVNVRLSASAVIQVIGDTSSQAVHRMKSEIAKISRYFDGVSDSMAKYDLDNVSLIVPKKKIRSSK